ncbi:MAG TPA: electron transfer flavoprotein subunit alpha/FixB family protein, partial [Clostridia bacterium]|nr:electron transfer flavoprotein subunit alpha/FixB family protein [Clostridia bacterium]
KAAKNSEPVRIHYPLPICNQAENKIAIYKQQNLPPEDAFLLHADIVVAAGRGVGNIQGLNLVKEFAESIKAPLCGSRGIVEDGLLPYSCQIGQTGKTIHPRLYIACGISGSAHHMSGVRADSIVAINKDPNAPIYEYADYGICGDIYDVLPKLIAGVRKSFPS